MSDATTSDLPDAAAIGLRTERHLKMLERLSEIGMVLAEEIGREALAEPDEAQPRRSMSDLALVFARVSHAVRQTIALEARLASDAQARDARAEKARVEAELDCRREEARLSRGRRKAEVRAVVATVIEVERSECVRDLILHKLDARLEREDEDGDLFTRPLGEAIASICRDFALSPDWSEWDADWVPAATAYDAWRDPVDADVDDDPDGTALFAALDEITQGRRPP